MLLADCTWKPFFPSQVFSIMPYVISSSTINTDFISANIIFYNTKVSCFG